MHTALSSGEGNLFLREMQAIGRDCLREIGSNPYLVNLTPRPKADFIHDYFRQRLSMSHSGKLVVSCNSYYLILNNFGLFFKKGSRKNKYLPELNESERSEMILNKDSGLFKEDKLEPLFIVWDSDPTWSRLNFFIGQLETRRQWGWIQSVDQYVEQMSFVPKLTRHFESTMDYNTPAKAGFDRNVDSNIKTVEEVAV